MPPSEHWGYSQQVQSMGQLSTDHALHKSERDRATGTGQLAGAIAGVSVCR